jgi:hypothetical protein
VQSTNPQQCSECITAASPGGCCDADFACSLVSDCLVLLQCTGGCANDPTCISSCQNKYPKGMPAYLDLAQCINSVCTPMCPTLPLAEGQDF